MDKNENMCIVFIDRNIINSEEIDVLDKIPTSSRKSMNVNWTAEQTVCISDFRHLHTYIMVTMC